MFDSNEFLLPNLLKVNIKA